ncbi:alpha-L-rhamnosidase [Streptococcus marmotae]|uniref:alpha-L-rhamnosidase n=1 Tax=Streptococcus marmotae TaxID=1825069 RepID=UPI00083086EE|nr:alpha-L-rhamnosidase [Streptococcus marmotae]
MNITDILINHLVEPLGYDMSHLHITFKIEASHFQSIEKKVRISSPNGLCYETDFLPYDNNFFDVDTELLPRTRYDVEVLIRTINETISASTFFETGKRHEPFTADWIAHPNKNLQNTVFRKQIDLKDAVISARLYMTGLGVYETYLDGEKIGNEMLAPGCTDYTKWIQIQTYDVTSLLQAGKTDWTVSTGDGWYKGIMGFDGGKDQHYGDHHRIIAELYIDYANGQTEVIKTDNSWSATAGQVTKSAIYYGEDLDDRILLDDWEVVEILDESKDVLCDRMSPPLVIDERLAVQEIILTPAGETVLDFGQNHAGIFEFYNRLPEGHTITLEAGECLLDGNFYRDNLRYARATFSYTSNGKEGWVRPHFTYFGYRYVRVSGHTSPINPEDFKAAVVFSQMEFTGDIQTNHSSVNRLFQNVKWGQKSNFFDVPTDCPQRDERLGWTGDANVFSTTAALNANVYPFFRKFAKDMAVEQAMLDGMTPMYAPSFGNHEGGAAVWGDATTVVPWNMYQIYGDDTILRQHYPSMKAWVDWISRSTKTENLWTGGFQFGDWIALDGENPALPTGKTDENFIASVYYYYSSQIVAKTASLLGYEDEASIYRILASNIKTAIRNEFITSTGRLAIDTQTAYALALYFELIPKAQIPRVLNDLVTRLGKDEDHLKTGFVGTPFICQVLSKYGEHKLATKIFLHEDYPSWLYAINKGATTIWERWNSIQEDDTMHPDGMNSLNHYSIGAIMEWAYCYILGLGEHTPGYQRVTLSPKFDYRLKNVKGYFTSSYGKLSVAYQIESDVEHRIQLQISVPFGQTVELQLPRSESVSISINEMIIEDGTIELTCGQYTISYIPNQDYIERYSAHTSVRDIMLDTELVDKIEQIADVLQFFKENPDALNGGLGTMSITKLNTILPFINIEPEALRKVNNLLESTPLLSQR